MKKLIIPMILLSGLALAGEKIVYPVSVYDGYAFGSIASARNSTDTRQLLGCYVSSTPTSTAAVGCYASNSAGTYRSCVSYAPSQVQAVMSVSGDSWLFFTYDAGGTCTSITVYNASNFEPKQP